MNKIELTGRLTRDPDLRYTPNNRPVAQFTIAVNRRYAKETDEIKAEEVEFLTPKKTTDNSNNETIPGEEHTPYDYQEEQASIYDNEFQLNDDDLPF